jgi:hypothetical protein
MNETKLKFYQCSAAADDDDVNDDDDDAAPVSLITKIHILNGDSDAVGDDDGRAAEVTSSEVAECQAWNEGLSGVSLGEVMKLAKIESRAAWLQRILFILLDFG